MPDIQSLVVQNRAVRDAMDAIEKRARERKRPLTDSELSALAALANRQADARRRAMAVREAQRAAHA